MAIAIGEAILRALPAQRRPEAAHQLRHRRRDHRAAAAAVNAREALQVPVRAVDPLEPAQMPSAPGRPPAALRASSASTSSTLASSDSGTNAGGGHGVPERRRRSPRARATSAHVRAEPEAVEAPSGTASARARAQAAASATCHAGARGARLRPRGPHAHDQARRSNERADTARSSAAPPSRRVQWRSPLWLPVGGALNRAPEGPGGHPVLRVGNATAVARVLHRPATRPLGAHPRCDRQPAGGLCRFLVSAMHITAGVWVNDNEPGILTGSLEWLDKIAPPSWKPPATGRRRAAARRRRLPPPSRRRGQRRRPPQEPARPPPGRAADHRRQARPRTLAGGLLRRVRRPPRKRLVIKVIGE